MLVRRMFIGLVVAMLVGGCSGPAATAPTPQQPTALAPTLAAQVLPTAPVATLVARVSPTALAPTLVARVSPQAPSTPATQFTIPGSVAPVDTTPPTPTPPFPERQIDVDTAAELQLIRTVGVGQARDAVLSADKTLLIVATSGGFAYFDAATFEQRRFTPLEGGAFQVQLSEDAELFALARGNRHDQHALEYRRISDGMLLETTVATFEPKPLTVNSPSGKFQAQFNPADSVPTPGVRIIQQADQRTIYEDTEAESISFSADDTTAVLVGFDGRVRLLDLNQITTRDLPVPGFWGATFDPNGQKLVTSGYSIHVWNVVTGQQEASYPLEDLRANKGLMLGQQRLRYGAKEPVLMVDGEYPVFESLLRRGSSWKSQSSALVHQWDSEINEPGISNFTTHVAALNPLAQGGAVTNDGFVLELYRDKNAHLSLQRLNRVTALEFSPAEQLLAVGDQTGTIELLQERDGAVVETFTSQQAVLALAFSPDGSHLAAQLADGSIMVWQRGTAQPIATLQSVLAPNPEQLKLSGTMIFTADHRMLLVRAADGVRFYNLRSGQLAHTVPVLAKAVAIGPRRRAVAILHDGYVQLWGLR